MTDEKQTAGRTGGREPTVLVVDDDPRNLAVMSEFLSQADYRILIAEDGESALNRAEYARPDLILLDIMMPGMDGFETCNRLKSMESTKDIPVIFMTALAEVSHKMKGFQAGAVDYITKPFHEEEIMARVGVHMHIRELTIALRHANESLEQKIRERTEELDKTNNRLQEEVAERKRIEHQLRMLNRFINTLNDCDQVLLLAANEGIISNLNTLQQYMGNLGEFIQLQSEILEKMPKGYKEEGRAVMNQLEERRQAVKLDHLVRDVPDLIRETLDEARRMQNIVLNLKKTWESIF